MRVPNASDLVTGYLEQPGANKSTVGKFTHKAAELAVLTHMLNKEAGPGSRCRMYQGQAKSTYEPVSRKRGLVVLQTGSDDDLDDPVPLPPSSEQIRLNPDNYRNFDEGDPDAQGDPNSEWY